MIVAVAVTVAGPAIVARARARERHRERDQKVQEVAQDGNHQTLVEMACALIAYRAAIRRKDHAF